MILVVLSAILGLLGLALTGAVFAHNAAGRIAVYGGSLLVCTALLAAGIAALGAEPSRLVLPVGLPWIGAHVRLDSLSGCFLAVIGLGGAGASLYGIGQGRHEHDPQRVLPFYPAFLAGMAMVVIADDAFSFLFAWELMSFASWALVMAHHRAKGTAWAGFVYIVMATFSGLALLLCFGLLAGPAGGYSFDAMRAAPPAAGTEALVFALALLGAGAKAGLVPVHVWLPLAHPAAPSHVSALMSGVMTKVALYGFLRIVFELCGPPVWWFGLVVLVLGGITAVLGVLHALMEKDLKRLLAYSTVENIGIVFLGFGLALAFRANGFAVGAALALTAALFHAVNHAAFKSLLFLGAGAVLTATGERDMDRLGGLIHRMPRTAFLMLVGCIAISALPPLNGFVSEWLTFQAILLRAELPQWGLKLAIPAVGALLALAAALAAACFVRAFGIAFLGRPRSRQAADASEVDGWSFAAMAGFATLCLLGGVLPGVVIDALAPVSQALVGAHMPAQLSVPWLTTVPVEASRSSYNGLLLFGFIALSSLIAVTATHRFASRALRRGPAWDCGFPDASPATQYTATSFSQPLRRVFGTLVLRARETVEMPPPGSVAPARIHRSISDPIWDFLYAPVGRAVAFTAGLLNYLQFLTIRRYLGFVFAALVLLLASLAIWQ
jgi:formate hydrogenlyase subunit 3/multisubunit Na+/H+ antiporter MnhD subunit